MTPAEVETQARRRYNSASDTVFFTQAEMFQWIYEAEMELSKRALVIEDFDESTSTTASDNTYAIPTNYISIKRLEYDGQKLQRIDNREDDLLTSSNRTTTDEGTPQYYYVWNDVVYLRPIPDAAKTLSFYGYKEPTALTTASTSLSIPSRYHVDLVDYVTAQMAFKDKELVISDRLLLKWEDKIRRAEIFERKRRRRDAFAAVKDEEQTGGTTIGVV
jgi:hypothetical protein